MMKPLKSLLAVCAFVLAGLISCSKTGDTGPAGPPGPPGPESVFSSEWIELAFTYNTDDSAYEDIIDAPTVTKAILDSGIILTYVNSPETDGTYHVIPVSALSQFFYEDYSVGKINLFAGGDDFNGLPYRYVTIPGSLTTGNSTNRKYNGYSATELKSMSYEKVQQVVEDKNQ